MRLRRTPCRPVTFDGLDQPLNLSQGASAAIYCDGQRITTTSARGLPRVASGATLSLIGCDIWPYATAAAALNVPKTGEQSLLSIFVASSGAGIVIRDSTLLFPSDVRAGVLHGLVARL